MENRYINKRITVYGNDGVEICQYEGDIKVYKEDYRDEGCVHFQSMTDGCHHRIYGGTVIVDEI